MTSLQRRVVITGMGLISPLGNTIEKFETALASGTSGVRVLTRVPPDHLPSKIGGEAIDFSGDVDDFGELDKLLKRSIKKGLKLMCREIQMGVAAAQRALAHAGLNPETCEPTRIGTMFGCDYILTDPHEFVRGVIKCRDDQNQFHFERWADHGLTEVEPLWLLKYLPNMPASHVAIYNDLRGPSNSLTTRETSSCDSLAEAATIIARGTADQMIVGATGSSIHPMRTLHLSLQQDVVDTSNEEYLNHPERACRPFDKDRAGVVLAEGAGSVAVEALDVARDRGASILGEVIGYGSSVVARENGVADYRQAAINAIEGALRTAELKPEEIGHVNAHGLGSRTMDREEAQAIQAVLGDHVPVMALKGYTGNMGAGSGLVELIGSLLAFKRGSLFPSLNYQTPDEECPVNVVTAGDVPPGDTALCLNLTDQGQAAAVVVRRV